MARTVTSPIVLPDPATTAASEVCDLNGVSGGLYRLGQAVNTLHAHLRGTMVADTGGTVLNGLGQIAYYRCKTIVGDTILNRACDCWAYVTTTGNATLQFRDAAAGTSVNVVIVGATTAWVGPGSLRIGDTTEYRTIEVEWTAIAAAATLICVTVFDDRAAAVLPGVAAGAGAYTTGFVPIDLAKIAGERPVSAHLMTVIHQDLVTLWERRTGQIVATYRTGGIGASPLFWQQEPPTTHAQSLTARMWVYWNGAGLVTDSVTLQSGSDIAIVLWIGAGWYSLDVTVEPPATGGTRPSLEDFSLAWTSGTIYAISGYWVDSTYL